MGSGPVASTESVAEALSQILQVPLAAVPVPRTGHPEPWTVWRNWLAQRALGLVPVEHPAAFGWPGPWLVLLPGVKAGGSEAGGAGGSGGDAGLVGAVAFGVPPGLLWSAAPETVGIDGAVAGFVVAPTDVGLWMPAAASAGTSLPSSVGTGAGPSKFATPVSKHPAPAARNALDARSAGWVEGIAVAPAACEPLVKVDQAEARPGAGLAGDRYAAGVGTFSNPNATGTDLTLVEAEALEALVLPSGPVDLRGSRRNIATRGIDLNALVGQRFWIGNVECFGQRLCEPCAHLERLTSPGVLRGLVHRGGLRADILTPGTIRVGDTVRRG